MPFQPRRAGGIGGAAGFDGERMAGRQLAHGAEERAGADVIPGAEQHALGGVPYAEGVVAEQLARAIRTPLGEGAEDQFGIGCLATLGAGNAELVAKRVPIVDACVGDRHQAGGAVDVQRRLAIVVPGGERNVLARPLDAGRPVAGKRKLPLFKRLLAGTQCAANRFRDRVHCFIQELGW